MAKYKAYPEYKDSGVEWLGEIPEDWSVTKLKYIADLQTAKSTNSDELFVGLENISSGDGKYISKEESIADGTSVSFQKNDVLFGKLRPYLAKSWLATFSGVCSSEFLVLRTAKLHPKYLNYYSLTNEFIEQVNSSTYGSKMPRANWEFIGLLPVPTCSYSLSERVAWFLDYETAKIDHLIEKQQQLIELLKEKRQAVISHAVTKGLNPDVPMKDSGVEWLGEVPEHWEVVYIKHLTAVKRGASPRPIDDPKYFDDDGEYSWTRIADVSNSGMYLTETTQRLSKLGASLSVRLDANQLFLSIAGTVGKPCLTTSRACIHDGFVYFPSLKINNKFLYYIFEAGQAYLGLGKMGTQLNLNTDTVGGISIGLPTDDEIEHIVEYIESQKQKYDIIISTANKTIELMQERRTALISAAVTGKIDVRDWVAPETQDVEKPEEATA
ncbi:hypothetical protein B1H58_04635 [Pantoea alhagi]|uniref:Type I restriction modification DNA specificity domain-containing protein n=1 Tax=Pantoea alhagi TaxID=1891675 RepID=A0A1W6B2S7_9GAMM|nr:restriction endonuclease subunit S [Pantoea alhagi]ARJ41366.1 hypothetical protein B1H58_04635 [Pantoea alhagi]